MYQSSLLPILGWMACFCLNFKMLLKLSFRSKIFDSNSLNDKEICLDVSQKWKIGPSYFDSFPPNFYLLRLTVSFRERKAILLLFSYSDETITLSLSKKDFSISIRNNSIRQMAKSKETERRRLMVHSLDSSVHLTLFVRTKNKLREE
jgi:hypothetical protein